MIGTTAVTYQYDGLSRQVLATDNNDRLDPSDDSAVTHAYDSLGRVVEETQRIGAGAPKAIDSSWSGENHRFLVLYPNGRLITNAFDRLGRLLATGDFGGAAPIAAFSYIGRPRGGAHLPAPQHPIDLS